MHVQLIIFLIWYGDELYARKHGIKIELEIFQLNCDIQNKMSEN